MAELVRLAQRRVENMENATAMKPKIRFRDGYKYQLAAPYWLQTEIYGFDLALDGFVVLEPSGMLTFNRGYAWDGPSGPTVDTKNSMRGSLVHDGLYQLMGVEPELLQYRPYADDLLYSICCEDGMSSFRAYLWRKMVNWFGGKAAREGDTIMEAP